MEKIVILGAGKIARGFIAHLLFLSGKEFIFIDKIRELVDLINQRKSYTVRVLGAPEKNATIGSVHALCSEDKKAAAQAIAKADIIFTAAGGKNLPELVPLLATGLKARFHEGIETPVNIITCENWTKPADVLRSGITGQLDKKMQQIFKRCVGITEAVVMRSAIEAEAEVLKEDPIAVNVQDFWDLPIDASRLKGQLPEIIGLRPICEFEGFLERKFYTYNAANGTVSYLGFLKGYRYISDAAYDPEILEILEGVYQETAVALSKKHGFAYEEQMAFTRTSLKKLQDVSIIDFIERNARDPIRKLGPSDRLVGSAQLVLSYGGIPEHLAMGIAAALYYDEPSDPSAQELRRLRESEGLQAVLSKVCGLEPKEELTQLVLKKLQELHAKGWILKI